VSTVADSLGAAVSGSRPQPFGTGSDNANIQTVVGVLILPQIMMVCPVPFPLLPDQEPSPEQERMTEQEWLISTDPDAMLAVVSGTAGNRKRRLLAAACCREVFGHVRDERFLCALELIARDADFEARHEEVAAADDRLQEMIGEAERVREAAESDYDSEVGEVLCACPSCVAGEGECLYPVNPTLDGDFGYRALEAMAASESVVAAGHAVIHALSVQPKWHGLFYTAHYRVRPLDARLRSRLAYLVREVFGNPFRRVGVRAAWLAWNDGSVERIAQRIYDERAFEALPILADALEDAGCNHPDLLTHLRSDRDHVCGCWALDLLLDKT